MISSKMLMIGDWVLVDDLPTKVTDIDESEGINREWIGGVVCEDAGCISWEHIKPIPLTPEILEKNGFEKNRDYGYYIGQSNSGYHIYFDNNYLSIQAGYDIIEFAWCEYVHKLQHALLLCGIEKEIKL